MGRIGVVVGRASWLLGQEEGGAVKETQLQRLRSLQDCSAGGWNFEFFYSVTILNTEGNKSDGLFSLSVLKDAELSPHWAPSLGGERHWCVLDLIGADLKPVSHAVAALSPDPKRKELHTFHISASSTRTLESHAKRSNNALNGAAKFKKSCSNAEVGGTASETCGSS